MMEEGLRLMRREIQKVKANRSMWRMIGLGMLHEGMSMEAARGYMRRLVVRGYAHTRLTTEGGQVRALTNVWETCM